MPSEDQNNLKSPPPPPSGSIPNNTTGHLDLVSCKIPKFSFVADPREKDTLKQSQDGNHSRLIQGCAIH